MRYDVKFNTSIEISDVLYIRNVQRNVTEFKLERNQYHRFQNDVIYISIKYLSTNGTSWHSVTENRSNPNLNFVWEKEGTILR